MSCHKQNARPQSATITWRKQNKSQPFSPATTSRYGDTLLWRTICWMCPWPQQKYPGRIKTFLSVLGMRVTWGAVAGWISGRRKLPAWAAEMIAEHIASRCETGLHLAAELRAYAEALEASPRK